MRIDLSALDLLPTYVRLSLAGARPPEPPEAALLGHGRPLMSVTYARSVLAELGILVSPMR